MRFMVLVPGAARSEAGEMPTTERLEAMTRFNQELAQAGVLLAGGRRSVRETSRLRMVRPSACRTSSRTRGPPGRSKRRTPSPSSTGVM